MSSAFSRYFLFPRFPHVKLINVKARLAPSNNSHLPLNVFSLFQIQHENQITQLFKIKQLQIV